MKKFYNFSHLSEQTTENDKIMNIITGSKMSHFELISGIIVSHQSLVASFKIERLRTSSHSQSKRCVQMPPIQESNRIF
jgi:hypothetical protein